MKVANRTPLLAMLIAAMLLIACQGTDPIEESPAYRVTAPEPRGNEEEVGARLLRLIEHIRATNPDDTLSVARAAVAASRFTAICDHRDLPASLSSPCSRGQVAIEDFRPSSFGDVNDRIYETVSRPRAQELNDLLLPDWDLNEPPSRTILDLLSGLRENLAGLERVNPTEATALLAKVNAVSEHCAQQPDQIVICATLHNTIEELSTAVSTTTPCGTACISYGLYPEARASMLLVIERVVQ